MKESIAKTKHCPYNTQSRAIENLTLVLLHTIAATMGNSSTMDMAAKQAGDLSQENMNHGCTGSLCMMWEPEYDMEEKEMPERATLEESRPEGDGWYHQRTINNHVRSNGPNTIIWRRSVQIDSGDCGLKTKELECNGQ